MIELPPLSFQSGPAVSGAPNESGIATTGDFIINKQPNRSALLMTAAVAAPVLLVGGIVWLLMRK